MDGLSGEDSCFPAAVSHKQRLLSWSWGLGEHWQCHQARQPMAMEGCAVATETGGGGRRRKESPGTQGAAEQSDSGHGAGFKSQLAT